ncbi:MAG TPA: hypothetical protein VGL81_03470 [Polyangiaceae bacterium]|jgi:hypothetical protein
MRTGLRPAILAVAGCGCVGASVVSACIVAPPAELADPSPTRPTILHGSVSPPPYPPLTSWTDTTQFVVPIQLGDINQSFEWWIVVDDLGDPSAQPGLYPSAVTPSPGSLDAGVYVLEFNFPPERWDLGVCHTIELFVGHGVLQILSGNNLQPDFHAFDSVGGDTISWYWNPPGCYTYSPDAGAVADASGDSLPIPPPSGDTGSE